MQETTVLIVDDEEAARATLRMMDWAAHGYRLVGEAENGRQALALIEAHKPDIALVDIVMPGLSGLDLIPEMKLLHPQLQVILVTMHRDFEYAREALRLGAREYLLKGAFQQMDLIRVLEEAKAALWDARRREALGEAEDLLHRTEVFERFLQEAENGVPGLDLPAHGMLVTLQWAQPQSLLLRLVYEHKVLCSLGPHRSAMPVRQAVWLLAYAPGGMPRDVEAILARQERDAEAGLFVTASTPFAAQDAPALRLAVNNALEGFSQRFYEPESRVTAQAYDRPVDPALGHALERRFQKYWQREDADPDFLTELPALCKESRMAPEAFRQLLAGWQRTVEKEFYQYNPSIGNRLLASRTAQEALQVFRSFLVASRLERASSGRLEVNQALAYIRDHLEENLSVETLASYAGLSANHFSLVFKGQTGESVHEHIVRLRMERAGQLLVSSTLKIYEVAERVGIPNVRYFTRAFANFYGVRPSAYREGRHA
ncbi:MAG TPA: response regulator [Clostridia bacterium]|nr:response regulator [Clostridia bacterium]